MAATGLACTLTHWLPVLPQYGVVTASVMTYGPAVAYWCVGFSRVSVTPSPKSQNQLVTGLPFAVVICGLKDVISPKQRFCTWIPTVGGSYTFTSRLKLCVQPNALVTVSVSAYVPGAP